MVRAHVGPQNRVRVSARVLTLFVYNNFGILISQRPETQGKIIASHSGAMGNVDLSARCRKFNVSKPKKTGTTHKQWRNVDPSGIVVIYGWDTMKNRLFVVAILFV